MVYCILYPSVLSPSPKVGGKEGRSGSGFEVSMERVINGGRKKILFFLCLRVILEYFISYCKMMGSSLSRSCRSRDSELLGALT